MSKLLPDEISTGWELVILIPVGGLTYLFYSLWVNPVQLREVSAIIKGKV